MAGFYLFESYRHVVGKAGSRQIIIDGFPVKKKMVIYLWFFQQPQQARRWTFALPSLPFLVRYIGQHAEVFI